MNKAIERTRQKKLDLIRLDKASEQRKINMVELDKTIQELEVEH